MERFDPLDQIHSHEAGTEGTRSLVAQEDIESVLDSLMTIKIVDSERLATSVDQSSGNFVGSPAQTETLLLGNLLTQTGDFHDKLGEYYIQDFQKETMTKSETEI